ncbi:peroxisomal biogenesis factor 3 [Sabethes cyaneus]|uniref:peroxisomal biogenesis factor 3 n=1 Tax=Sabethes cyaneus TaxID=53552 RepID=UPI00237E79F9|nr:peroxisomal biogenesis factor 3 [Sabethes cyaneus]
MLTAIKDFLYRHRRKLITTGVLLGGGLFLIKLIQYKLREFQERQASEIAEKFKRMKHFESTERTCNQTIVGLSESVSEKVLRDLSTTGILEKLRSNPESKLELWEELKILAFTKIVTLVYASSMLALTLKTQINLLGGYMYKETVPNDTQASYLSMIQHFMGEGMDQLMEVVRNNVTIVMQRHSLKQQLTLADAETLFWSIQMSLNNDERNPIKCMVKYTLPQDQGGNGDSSLRKMYDETLDVLESAEATDVCISNVTNGFSLIVDKLAEYYAEAEAGQPAPSTSKSSLNVDCLSNINNIKISLAKLIPIVNGLTAKPLGKTGTNGLQNGLEKHRNDMMSSLIVRFMQSEKLKTLGVNVYETFCA